MLEEPVGPLVEAAAAGDAAAWKRLVLRFSGLVWSIPRGFGLTPSDAEEVFQTTWFRLAEHLTRIKDPERLGGWLSTTARNESLKLAKARRLTMPFDEDDDFADDSTPESALLEAETLREARDRDLRFWSAFQDLPDRCRALLRMVAATPPPNYTDIATAMNMPIGSIGPTRARCLAKLRVLLAERGITGLATSS